MLTRAFSATADKANLMSAKVIIGIHYSMAFSASKFNMLKFSIFSSHFDLNLERGDRKITSNFKLEVMFEDLEYV